MKNIINYFSDIFDNNNDADYYYSLAQNENYEIRKIRLLKKVLRIEPNHINSLEELGFFYTMQKLHQKAISCYDKLLNLNSKNATAYYNLGVNKLGYAQDSLIHGFEKDVASEVIPLFKKAISINPDYIDALNNLSILYASTGRFNDAILLNENVLQIDSNNSRAYSNMANLYGEKENYRKAISLF